MQDDKKRRAAEHALELLENGQVVGLGTGSTAKFVIEGIARRITEGMSIEGVPTSVATERIARNLGIPLVELNDVETIDVTFDGADEVDSEFNMIKGGGGALTREKLIALSSRQRVILVDDGKIVPNLGKTHSLPIEVLPFAWVLSARHISAIGCQARLRKTGEAPFVTDNGNYILDCDFGPIDNPAALESRIKLLPGVIESGLFIGIADSVVIGFEDRVEVRYRMR